MAFNMQQQPYTKSNIIITKHKHKLDNDIKELNVFGDSPLVINQMKGNWKIYSSKLRRLNDEVRQLVKRFDKISFTLVLRNERAIELANDAL
jgi:ribonuclease HI